ncbi:MAG TPA: class II fructose-bisphosphatase [Candidatus Binatia bacterium]|nr:class II fructose-bisphosphatase [Candidatus Binatia bacterium]
MDRNLALEVVRVTEAAALASARLMGRGDAAACDRAATEAMHRAFEAISADCSVVIGEGRAGDVEHLWVGERIGATSGGPDIDVALDALEGATVCATGGANALSIILIAERGRILPCPETYMDKISVGAEGRGVVRMERSPTENLRALAEAKGVYVEDLAVVILDRPRHERLIDEVRRAGARVQLLADGDLAAAVAAARPGSAIDILLGVGGAQQGLLAAGAVAALGGEFQGRFRPRTDDEVGRLREAGIRDVERVYGAMDLVGDNVMFAATGVTGGHLLAGVRYFRGGATTNSVVMRSRTRTVRWIEAYHHFDFKPEY